MTLRFSGTTRLTRWHAVAAALMAAAAVVATSEAWADIVLLARRDEENSHVVLVPFVALWLAWVRRLRLRHCRAEGTGLGVGLVGAGWAAMALGQARHHQTLWHGGALLVVVGCVTSVLGRRVLARFFPAVAVLAFLVPVPAHVRQGVALPLQAWTAQVSQFVLQAIGISAERYGNTLRVNDLNVNIVEACNGLRMVFALVLVCYTFAFALPLRNRVRFFVLAASPLAAIAGNVLRILPTVWLYGYHSRRLGDTFHDCSGWLMLPASFLALVGILKALRWAMIPVTRYMLAG